MGSLRAVFTLSLLALVTACTADGNPPEYGGNLGSTRADVGYGPGDTSLLDLCGAYEIGTHPRAGTYVGYWREEVTDTLQAALIVDTVGEAGVTQILYSHGIYAPWDVNDAECERFAGRFTDKDTLVVDFRDGHRGTFEFINKGQVNATYVSDTGTTRGTFSGIEKQGG